jgi:hypothetical protein
MFTIGQNGRKSGPDGDRGTSVNDEPVGARTRRGVFVGRVAACCTRNSTNAIGGYPPAWQTRTSLTTGPNGNRRTAAVCGTVWREPVTVPATAESPCSIADGARSRVSTRATSRTVLRKSPFPSSNRTHHRARSHTLRSLPGRYNDREPTVTVWIGTSGWINAYRPF